MQIGGMAGSGVGRCHDPRRVVIVPVLPPLEAAVSEHVYRVTEIVGSSEESVDAAIRNGLARAKKTLHSLGWFEVTEIRGAFKDDDLGWFQVTMKVGFRLED
jgi:dodecin